MEALWKIKSKEMKSKILIVVALVLLIGAFIGYKMWNKPHMDIASADSFMTISANDLVKAFKEDEAAANAKFLNKVITVSGKIATVNQELGQNALHLETDDMMALVVCNLDPFSKHVKVDFKAGEQINLKGVCSGMLTDVIIDRCILVK